MMKILKLLTCIACIGVLLFSFTAKGAVADRVQKPHRFKELYRQIIEDTDYLSLGNQFSKKTIMVVML